MCDVTPLGVILTGCEIMARGCESTHYKTHDINITGPVWHAGTLFSWVRLFRSMSVSWHAYHAWRVLLCAFGARLRVCLGSRGRGRADTRPPSWSVLCGGRGLVACVLMLTTHTRIRKFPRSGRPGPPQGETGVAAASNGRPQSSGGAISPPLRPPKVVGGARLCANPNVARPVLSRRLELLKLVA